MLDEATREAIASEAKAEAARRDLSGDEFWAFVWARVEKAQVEAGMLPPSLRAQLRSA